LHGGNRFQQPAGFVVDAHFHLRRQVAPGNALCHHHGAGDRLGDAGGDAPGNQQTECHGCHHQHAADPARTALDRFGRSGGFVIEPVLQRNQLAQLLPPDRFSGCGAGHQVQAGGDGIAIVRCLHRALNLWPGLLGCRLHLLQQRSLGGAGGGRGNELCELRFLLGVFLQGLAHGLDLLLRLLGVDFVEHGAGAA